MQLEAARADHLEDSVETLGSLPGQRLAQDFTRQPGIAGDLRHAPARDIAVRPGNEHGVAIRLHVTDLRVGSPGKQPSSRIRSAGAAGNDPQVTPEQVREALPSRPAQPSRV